MVDSEIKIGKITKTIEDIESVAAETEMYNKTTINNITIAANGIEKFALSVLGNKGRLAMYGDRFEEAEARELAAVLKVGLGSFSEFALSIGIKDIPENVMEQWKGLCESGSEVDSFYKFLQRYNNHVTQTSN